MLTPTNNPSCFAFAIIRMTMEFYSKEVAAMTAMIERDILMIARNAEPFGTVLSCYCCEHLFMLC